MRFAQAAACCLSNLATDCAAVGTIADAIVLVLLVAQIDLSVGSTSGLAASIIGVGLSRHGWTTAEGSPSRS
jgi:D-xylose transport system permease protein